MFTNCHIVARDVNSDEYHGASQVERGNPAFVVSSSSLREFGRCPSKWVTPIKARDGSVSWFTFEGGKFTRWGSLFDCFSLTRKQFASRYVVHPEEYHAKGMECPSCKTVTDAKTCGKCKRDRVAVNVTKPWNWNADFCAEWKSDFESDGIIPISPDEHFKVAQATNRFRDFSEPGVKTTIGERLDASDKQIWVRGEWHDDSGIIVPVQCLIDYVPRLDSDLATFDPCFAREIGDVKTTCNASPRAWERWALQAGYDVQAAWYCDMLQAAENAERDPSKRMIDSCRFLLSESHAPWQPGQRVMTDDGSCGDDGMSLNVGRKHYKQLLSEYCRCIKTGKWPGYDSTELSRDGVTEVMPNPYATRPRFEIADEPETEQAEEMDVIP